MGQSSIECILVGSPGVVCDLEACLVFGSIVVNVDVRALIESVVEGFGGRRSEIIVDVGKAIEFTQSELSRVSIDDVCGWKVSSTHTVKRASSPGSGGMVGNKSGETKDDKGARECWRKCTYDMQLPLKRRGRFLGASPALRCDDVLGHHTVGPRGFGATFARKFPSRTP